MELDRHKSEASPFLEFLVCLVSLRGHVGDVIASLTLSKEKIRKLVKLAEQPGAQGQAPLAVLQKLAGKLFFSQTAAIHALQKVAGEICSGSFGAYLWAKLRGGGGVSPQGLKNCLKWRDLVSLSIDPRLITGSTPQDVHAPIRIYSGTRGEGRLASLSSPPEDGRPLPVLLSAQSDLELRNMAAKSIRIYIFELFAPVASVPSSEVSSRGAKSSCFWIPAQHVQLLRKVLLKVR